MSDNLREYGLRHTTRHTVVEVVKPNKEYVVTVRAANMKDALDALRREGATQ